MASKGFGFVYEEALPPGSFASGEVKGAARVRWATTPEFDDVAKDHCGAVLVANVALYFRERGYERAAAASVRETFLAVRSFVGDGPVAALARKASAYFASRGYALVSKDVPDFGALRTAVDADEPCAVLLARGLVNWHWVLCIGYRSYDSGPRFMRIVDGWHDATDIYYPVGSGAIWWSATRYRIK